MAREYISAPGGTESITSKRAYACKSSLIKDLSVDWVNRKIFWVDWNTQNIYQTDLKDNSREVVLFHPSKIHQLAIDPYYR
ncbi:hypothetical protein J6590_078234 [Homalodisca vitripennis]|nr:hypothetical protein J6590_078234 [Homalodisca vitripennis]